MNLLPFTEKQSSLIGIAASIIGIAVSLFMGKLFLLFVCATALLLGIVRFATASISSDYCDTDL